MTTPKTGTDALMAELVAVMARLRDKENGCPWDIEQSFASIAPYTIEEAYEVADAIARDNMDDLKDELGDLLLQVLFHSQMAAEAGHFTINDVMAHLASKLISRHPHVFGDAQAGNSGDVLAIWEARKEAEKAAKAANRSVMDDVTLHLPALLRAQKLQKKAAKVGFEWPDISGVLEKLEEEINELKEAIKTKSSDEISAEFGDVLFVLVNFGRKLDIDCETALKSTNDKFVRRFKGMEGLAKAKGQDFAQLDLEAQDALWNAMKAEEKRLKAG